MISADVTFLENTSFSQDPIYTNQGEDDDFLVYTLASLAPAFVPHLTKPPITQVYSRRQNSLVLSPTLAALTLDPVSSDDLPIALRKGKLLCVHLISSFCSYNHLSSHSYSFIASLDSISLHNTVHEALSHPGWRSAMVEEM